MEWSGGGGGGGEILHSHKGHQKECELEDKGERRSFTEGLAGLWAGAGWMAEGGSFAGAPTWL